MMVTVASLLGGASCQGSLGGPFCCPPPPWEAALSPRVTGDRQAGRLRAGAAVSGPEVDTDGQAFPGQGLRPRPPI